LLQVIREEPVPPSRLQSQVPRDLETICLTSLAKEPHKRYLDAEALAEDLGRYLADEPIRARRTPLWERGLKWARRRPTTSTLLAVGMTAALGLVVAGLRYDVDLRNRALGDDRRLAAERRSGESDLRKARDDLMDGRFPDGEGILNKLMT